MDNIFTGHKLTKDTADRGKTCSEYQEKYCGVMELGEAL